MENDSEKKVTIFETDAKIHFFNHARRWTNHARGGKTSPGGTDLTFPTVSTKARIIQNEKKNSHNFPVVM